MLKSFTLKRMANKTKEFLSMNERVFEKYDASVYVRTKTNYLCIMKKNNVDHIIPYGILCSYDHGPNDLKILRNLESITLCMNSIYEIAKIRKQNPMLVLEQVLDSLISGLKQGVLHREISEPHPNQDKVKSGHLSTVSR